MKYNIFDNDNDVMVCTTDSRKEAFTAILNHLIAAHDSDVPDPIMWPVADLAKPEDQMPDVSAIRQDAWSVIRQAKNDYEKIVCLIPMEYPY